MRNTRGSLQMGNMRVKHRNRSCNRFNLLSFLPLVQGGNFGVSGSGVGLVILVGPSLRIFQDSTPLNPYSMAQFIRMILLNELNYVYEKL